MGEIHEITRVYGLARKATAKYHNSTVWAFHKKPPATYCLGTGHVQFHVDKLSYIYNRYSSLCAEARSRGYNINQISEESLSQGIDKTFFRSYNPTQESIEINRQRIADRIGGIR